ncbi:MAG: AAA family ATPase [Desulfobacterales bacterium]|uniref:DNA 3'-5' helicase II n=1 Tax=Candidatus Desulfatibia profunda TaxID=2841695 RepID=A0A8J6NQT7_9BACT|nr:AAA family ATPase [Candidatus Desulfatibia profunda]MBL7179014.1 AAA family ATPase [Desulfobacterales bacterium]
MATMIPENVESFTTEGEKQSYRFLEAVAKPDSQYLCWYLPDIHGKEPDFILFSNKLGLIIFEVKDWQLDQIKEANPHYFIIQKDLKTEKLQNPCQQAREYLIQLIETIKSDRRLVSKDPIHRGNPKIPINCGVIFPNINKYEYIQKGFDRVIAQENIFFWDDLHPASPLCCDSTGACFAQTVESMFPPKFSFSLTGSELDHLKQLIFPVVKIELPVRRIEHPYTQRINRLKSLDHHQEALARKFDGGHRIIIGSSGSGKTLILVHKAVFLARYNPDIKNILFVCFNITLVNYIKRLLADKGAPLGENGVQVFHFYQLCSEIIGENVAYEKEDSEYYELVIHETLSQIENFKNRFDAILVDEGQDFSDDMYRIVSALLNPKTNNLTIALDDNQNIYQRESSWKDVGIQARGRVHKISYVYRNTKEISEFASNFIRKEALVSKAQKEEQLKLYPDFFDFSGPKPVVKQFEGFEAIFTHVAEEIQKIVRSKECPCSDIAIIYTMKLPGDLKNPLPLTIKKALEARGIFNNWVSENYRSKNTYDITTNSVTISTIHSVKGLDYSNVFLLGLDFMEPKRWSEEQINNLVYVAITRARYQLFIPYIHGNSLISKLISCL